METYNLTFPYIMHIDLNSCFATIEQQANRLLRGKPVGISAYNTKKGFVLAASYDAKRKGVKLGVNNAEARALCPDIVILTPDPAKYREAHKRFKELLLEYTPDVVPKSIDEFVLDFEHSPVLRAKRQKSTHDIDREIHHMLMREIGEEIKLKICERLGEAVTVNVGIGPNRFLAKYAAGFNKPNGMTLIDCTNLREYYTNQDLVDLPGINVRYRRRLFMAGITTPIEFLEAPMDLLKKRVFKSIVGYYWYLRLRGYEIDIAESKRGSIGHQYALSRKTTDMGELERLLLKLCEKTGRRLRKNNLYAQGIHLYLGFVTEYVNGPVGFEQMHELRKWHKGIKLNHRLYSTFDVYEAAKYLLHEAVLYSDVRLMAVTVYGLHEHDPEQMTIFDSPDFLDKAAMHARDMLSDYKRWSAQRRVSDAMDIVNNRYGEFVVTPATMMDMRGTILDRIAFGQVRDL
jgi:DNA polymerase-4